ncbi:MAG: hypothetical protein AABX82_02840, partial [Nanoarchaeota archaeon]
LTFIYPEHLTSLLMLDADIAVHESDSPKEYTAVKITDIDTEKIYEDLSTQIKEYNLKRNFA